MSGGCAALFAALFEAVAVAIDLQDVNVVGGNQFTVWLVRHSQRKRGATDRPDLRSMAPILDPTRRVAAGILFGNSALT